MWVLTWGMCSSPGPLNLVLEGLHRQAEDLLIGGGEVDEIDRMDDGVLDVSALAALEELLGIVGGERAHLPAAGVMRKNLQRVNIERFRASDGLLKPPEIDRWHPKIIVMALPDYSDGSDHR
jgi:hypothetical protein